MLKKVMLENGYFHKQQWTDLNNQKCGSDSRISRIP